jgi:PAS domain S-box-containing protein
VLKRVSSVLPLILIGLVVNIAVGQVVRNVLRLPFYLDSIGTVLVGALAGPLAGAVTGALSNVAWGLLFNDPGIIPYAITAACIGVSAGIAASLGAFKDPLKAALSGLLTGVIAALVSAPISAHLLQGSTGGGVRAVQEVLQATGANLLQAVTLQGFMSDPLDKAVSFLAVWLILARLPDAVERRLAPADTGAASYRSPYRYGVASLLSLAALGFTLVFLPAFGSSVYAIFYAAVVLSAWNGGLGPGLLATGIGAAATVLLPMSQGGQRLQPADWLNLCIFLTVSSLIALIIVALERANRALNAALAEQRQREAEIRAIVDGVVEALLLVAPDQRVLSVNRQVEEMFGVASNQVTGQRIDDLRPLVERVFADPQAFAARVEATANDTSARFTETFAQVWPQERQLEVFSAPVRSDGRVLGRLFGFRDVTQERELDRMKTEFVSQVSHELRTPLTAIKGFTDLLLDGDAGEVNEEQEEYLQIVRQNVDRLVSLINDLLDISRIESGRIKLSLDAIDMGAIIQSVVATLRPLIQGKDQSITVEVAPDLPQARGDHDRILQVVTNLVSNAYKYTPARGAIRVEASRADDLVRVAVRDTGIGIPEEDIPKLFTRFFRVDSSLTREIGGTGLGLSIVKSIVELHGGTVSVESTPGSGSTFSFTLPAAPAGVLAGPVPVSGEPPPVEAPVPPVAEDVPQPVAAPAGGRNGHGTGGERTVLVVDDDEATAAAIGQRLGGIGYRVETAGSADAALQRVAARKPDLVVLRGRLSGEQGLDSMNRLATAPELHEVPMLVLPIVGEQPAGAEPATAASRQVDQEQLLQHVRRAMMATDRRQVLVVEDDPSVRRLLAVALRNQDFEVLEAPDGETGLALAEQHRPELILLDLRLPGIDGFQVLQALKRSPATAAIPVIAVTGSEGLWLGARARVLALGAADFVAKPFEMDALIREVRILMDEEEVHRADASVSG